MNQTPSLTTRKRAVAYVRISSQRQVNNESPMTQRDVIQRFADTNDIEIVGWFEDIAKSGKDADRDGLQSLMQYCMEHKGEIDNWLVYNIKRASRDIDTYSNQVRVVLKALGVTIRSATEPAVDDTKEGRFMETLLVALGQLDNEGKSEVTKDNMRALAAQGYWQSAPMLGYGKHEVLNDLGKTRPTLKPNRMAPLVKQVLERFSQGDVTKAELTRYAASIGLRSRYGNKLSDDRVIKLLRQPVYAGYVVGKHTNGELVRGVHEPIISTETFELNQAILNNKSNRAGEVHLKHNPDYPLKGLVLCPSCNNPLYASAPKTGAGGKSPRYHCSRPSCRGLVKSVATAQMHGDFAEMLERIKPSEQVLDTYRKVLITQAANRLGNLNGEIGKVRGKLDVIAENRLTAIRKFNADELTLDEKTDLITALDEEKAVYRKELARLESQQNVREGDINLAVDVMRDVAQQWQVASLASKVRFQNMIFPEGLVYDADSRRFGTSKISPLYRYAPNKKDSPEPEKSFLVAGVGFEPTTFWL